MTQPATHQKSAGVQEECKQQQDLQKGISPSAYAVHRGQMFHKPATSDTQPFNQITVILRVCPAQLLTDKFFYPTACFADLMGCLYTPTKRLKTGFWLAVFPTTMRGFNKVFISLKVFIFLAEHSIDMQC